MTCFSNAHPDDCCCQTISRCRKQPSTHFHSLALSNEQNMWSDAGLRCL